jgi:hypothetical protein
MSAAQMLEFEAEFRDLPDVDDCFFYAFLEFQTDLNVIEMCEGDGESNGQ